MTGSKNNILVVYYSFEGNTEFIAQAIAEATNGDILKIMPVKELASKGFFKFIWGGRQAVMKTKPELEPFSVNPLDYNTIFIGTPVWASTFSPPIRSFIDKAQLKGKKIAIFCSHDGGPKNTLDKMANTLNENKIIGEMEFLHPLKSDPEQKALDAVKWAQKLIR